MLSFGNRTPDKKSFVEHNLELKPPLVRLKVAEKGGTRREIDVLRRLPLCGLRFSTGTAAQSFFLGISKRRRLERDCLTLIRRRAPVFCWCLISVQCSGARLFGKPEPACGSRPRADFFRPALYLRTQITRRTD
jgi:hypothetical protein